MSGSAPSITLALAMGALASAALGCSDSGTGPKGSPPVSGAVVLNGFAAVGMTLLPADGGAAGRIDFADAFDGSRVTIARDSALTTSSKGGGDLLYVANLAVPSLLKIQMPAGSNPAGASFAAGTGRGNFLVALRDAQAVARVSVPISGSPTVALVTAAGSCPADAFAAGGAIWSLDANLDCANGSYTPEGPSRLIRIPDNGGARDTISLGAFFENAGSAVVVGDFAYVAASGAADFSNYPATTFVRPGAIAKVGLTSRQVVATRSLPQGSYGAGVHLGRDGALYVTAYTSTDFSKVGVFKLDPATMTFAGGADTPLALAKAADGQSPACAAATADAAGNVYCVENGVASAATLYVFSPAGLQLRSAPAGQGAVDVELR